MRQSSYQRPDYYSKQAKQVGFAARSAFKLAEIQQRWQLFRPGMHVLDLGCAPGSWCQYVSEQVGPTGRVLGIDLQAVTAPMPAWVELIQADMNQCPLPAGPWHAILSDMAPKTTGDRMLDTLRSLQLAEGALAWMEQLLQSKGAGVIKVLEGKGFASFCQAMRNCFTQVTLLRPKATRSQSCEIFVIGRGFLGKNNSTTT